MSRPRKTKHEPSDWRSIEKPAPDYSDPEVAQSLKDTVKELIGIEVPDDDPCFDPSLDRNEAYADMASMARQHFIDKLRVDPKGDMPTISGIFGRVILDRSTDFDDDRVGKLLVKALKHPDPAVADRLFRQILKMKDNANQPHRNAFAYFAYTRFIEETEREPSKPELREYIEARREQYKDAPGPGDKAGWHRLWEESGLSDLNSR